MEIPLTGMRTSLAVEKNALHCNFQGISGSQVYSHVNRSSDTNRYLHSLCQNPSSFELNPAVASNTKHNSYIHLYHKIHVDEVSWVIFTYFPWCVLGCALLRSVVVWEN